MFSNFIELLSSLNRLILFKMIKLFGNLPNHAVFLINDVSRYYDYEKKYFTLEIYKKNFGKILECANWCSDLDIREVSFYIFGCSTYKFPAEEIAKSIDAFESSIEHWLASSDFFGKTGIRIRIVDENSVLPKTTKVLIEKLESLTRFNERTIVSMFVGIAGEKRLKESMGNYGSVVERDKTNELHFKKSVFEFVEEEPRLIVSNCKYKRLIDYLMWKIPSRYIHHAHIMWHQFHWFDILICLLHYEIHVRRFERISK